MFKVMILYPNDEGAKFDFDYYRTTHMRIVEENLKPFGLRGTSVEKGISGGAGAKAPYICVGSLFFDRPEGYDEGAKQVGATLRGDLPNFTNVTPTRLIVEVLD